MSSGTSLPVTKPVAVWNKPLQANFKDLFKALGKGVADGVTGQWTGLAKDVVDASVAVGLANDPGQVAWLLIYRSLTAAISNLVEDSKELFVELPEDLDSFSDGLDLTLESIELTIGQSFFEQPKALPVVKAIQSPLRQWLEGFVAEKAQAKAISNRLPSYFTFSLNREWAARPQDYAALKEQFHTPFAQASEREHGWQLYSAWLQKQIEEPMFSEAFGLKQVFVPLRAYYRRKEESLSEEGKTQNEKFERVVVELEEELNSWVQAGNPNDAIRVISGGPGAGKSSFVKIFAAHLAEQNDIPVLFIPLHQFDPRGELVDAVGSFVEYDSLLKVNPLHLKSGEPRLIIIFDGLDELAKQGKIAREIAQNFVEEVRRELDRFNQREIRLQILISGREPVVQDSSTMFRNPRQILHLLPHFIPRNKREVADGEKYVDAQCLNQDRRDVWWQCYGSAIGKSYKAMPFELDQGNLIEITAQPLLNYLVALSYGRKMFVFYKNTNLNQIYRNLLDAVYERAYERHGPHRAIQGMKKYEFVRILEEIALAAWHGDGRTTTVSEIEQHCDNSGLKRLLVIFEEGAESGVARLLTAFYFRQSGGLRNNERTFEFTHKSFGEYLTACRIVRAIERIQDELDARDKNPDRGWDERDAIAHWAIVCGPSQIDNYLFSFIKHEVNLRSMEQVHLWQLTLTKLIGFMLHHGMPMERLNLSTFQQANQQARNAEEALLAALAACARITKKISEVDWPTPEAFGAWLARLQGQKVHAEKPVTLSCLIFLDLKKCTLTRRDLDGANLNGAILDGANLDRAILDGANLESSSLQGASLQGARLTETNLDEAILDGAILDGAILDRARLVRASLNRARLTETRLVETRLGLAKLDYTILERAKLIRASLEGASLEGANFESATLDDALLDQAILDRAILEGASLEGASLSGASLKDITWNRKTNWQYLKEVEKAKNIPNELILHLGLQ